MGRPGRKFVRKVGEHLREIYSNIFAGLYFLRWGKSRAGWIYNTFKLCVSLQPLY